MEIKRHYTSIEHDARYQKNVNRIIDIIENDAFEVFEKDIKKYNLGSYMNHSIEIFNNYTTCQEQDRAIQTKLLFYWRILAKAYFHLAFCSGREIEVKFREKFVKHLAPYYKSHTAFSDWFKAYSVFRVLRDQSGLNILDGISEDAMARSEASWSKLGMNMMIFLANLNAEPEAREQYLISAIKSTDPDSGDYERHSQAVEYVVYIYEPVLFVYEALLQRGEEEFNNQLIEALNRHKKYYDTKKSNRYSNHNGLINWFLLGAVSLAYDRGMKISVKSDYIPEWLYKGEFDTSSFPPNWL